MQRGVVAKITPGGAITEYPLPTDASYPGPITAGPNGNVWFAESRVPEQVAKIGTGPVVGVGGRGLELRGGSASELFWADGAAETAHAVRRVDLGTRAVAILPPTGLLPANAVWWVDQSYRSDWTFYAYEVLALG